MALGSIAVFNLSFNLQSVPLTIIGVSYSMAAFPTLAALYAGGKIKEFIDSIASAARHIIFWALPITALFIVLRAQVVRTILGSGEFDWTSTRLVAAALALFAISVVAQSLVLLFVRGYYAVGKTTKPLVINVFSSGVIMVAAYLLTSMFNNSITFATFIENLFRVEGIPGTLILMLPLAYTIGMLINVVIFWISYEKDFPGFSKPLFLTLRHSFYAAMMMGTVSYIALGVFDNFFDLQTLVGIFAQGLFSGVVGIAAGVLLLKVLGNQELEDLHNTFHLKFWQRRPIPAPLEEADGV